MEQVPVTEFKENLTHFLKRVEWGEALTLVSKGHEVACLMPPENQMKKARAELRRLGQTAIIGDILSPIEDEWKENQ